MRAQGHRTSPSEDAASSDHRLRRSRRIRKRRDFLRVQRSGIRIRGSFLTLIAKRTPPQTVGRVGLTVAKAVGKAHVRNLVKRRLRHILRENLRLIATCDVVVIASDTAASASFEDLRRDLLHAFDLLQQKLAAPRPSRVPNDKPRSPTEKS